MPTIEAGQVRVLRERTGAGMMDCKRALQEANGDIDVAIDHMRKAGVVKAASRSGRTAIEGVVAVRCGDEQVVILEVNSETDFVARDACFRNFVDRLAETLLTTCPDSVSALLDVEVDGRSLLQYQRELIARVGENIVVRRFKRIRSKGTIGSYLHGHRIGVVVEMEQGSADLAHDIAMHVAASNSLVISGDELPEALLERERAVYAEQERQGGSSKPPEIQEKIIRGKLAKFIKESALLQQPFVKDTKQSVGQLLEQAGAKVVRFVRFELGEGLEKSDSDFVAEVMAQARVGSTP